LSSGEDGQRAFELIAAIHLSQRRGRSFVEFPLADRELAIPSN
jgi:hypothetical protein